MGVGLIVEQQCKDEDCPSNSRQVFIQEHRKWTMFDMLLWQVLIVLGFFKQMDKQRQTKISWRKK